MHKIKEFFWKLFSRLWAKKWRALVVVILLLWLIYWGYRKFFPTKADETFVSMDYTVITWDVAKTINLAGTTQFANAQKLTFVQKGRVTSVKVKVGDIVKKDQILATITTDELDKNVEKAKNTLKTAQRNLQKKLESSDRGLDLLEAQSQYEVLLLKQKNQPDEQALAIDKAQRDIKDTQKEYEDAKKDYQTLLSGKNGVTNADLLLSKTVRDRNEKFENLVKWFRNEALKLEKTLQDFDSKFKVTDDYLSVVGSGDRDHYYIGEKDVRLYERAKAKFWDMRKFVSRLKNLYKEYSEIPVGKLTEDQILSGYVVFKELGAEMLTWGKMNYEVAFDSSESWFSRDQIVDLANTYGTEYENAGFAYAKLYDSAVDTLRGLKDWDSSLEAAASKAEELRISLKEKEIQLEILKKQQLVDTAKQAQSVLEAKEKLERLKQNAEEPEDIELLKDAVDEAQLNLTTLMKQYEDYRIIANFDGVVTKLNMQVWDSIGVSNSNSDSDLKYIYVETPDLLEVNLEVDQIDIVKIQLGMPVQVFVDALPDAQFDGKFSEIDTLSDGNSYKAKVVFKKTDPDQKILGGMSATIKVILGEEKNAIIVPNPAIAESENGEKIVRLQKDWVWVDQIVELGLADDANTVILSGVNIGDLVKGLYINETSLTTMGVGMQEEEV